MNYQTTTNTFTPDTIKNLEIEAACSEISFDVSSDENIHVDAKLADRGVYTCELRHNTLSISYAWHKGKIIGPQLHELPLIVISLPDNFIFEQIDCDIAAGEVRIEKVPVSCRDMNVTIGAGKLEAAQLSVLNKLSADASAGEIKLNRANVDSLHLDCDAAKCFYEGRIDKEFKVSCSVGACKFKLENAESDLDLDISCSLGSILINDRKINALSSNNHCGSSVASCKGILECSVGKIILETT